MSSGQLPPEVQDKIQKLQQLQQKAENISMQKQQTDMRLGQVEDAIDELREADEDTEVYRNLGDILIEKEGPSEVIDELEEEKEDLNLRVKTLERQEEKVKDKLQELQQELQKKLQGMRGGGGVPGPGEAG